MFEPRKARAFRLGMIAMALCGGMMTAPSVYALKDPLEIPAIKAPKAARAMALNVVSQGNTVILVGERGIILKKDWSAAEPAEGPKDTEGRRWTQLNVPVSVNLTSIALASDKVFYVVGHDGVVLKSADAGVSWAKVFDGNKANEQVVAAAKKKFEDAQAAVDSAAAAKAKNLADLEAKLEAAQFALEDAEAGARFGPARPMLDVWFKDETTGWVVGSYGQIFETTDGGGQWTLVSARLDNEDFKHYNGLYGDETGLMLIAGEAGRIFMSKDFGQTWKRMETGYNGHFYGTAVVKDDAGGVTIFAYGFGGNVYRLGAGAEEWWRLKSPTKESLVKAVVEGKSVLMVDQKGRVLKTDESGTSISWASTKEGVPVTGMARVGATNTVVLSGQNGPRTLELPK